ncbi:MAG: PBP1A family penicillin-binding protein [Algiphilus sp.]|nr:PBP1A family penicillin-binding protein [Algiphilus sp.]MCI5104612.1 PBP1A family penicillin-binding protein [Algiphilus sp.]
MSLPARVALRLAIVLALVLIAGALFTVAAFFTARAVYEPQLPPVEAVRELPLQVPLRIYSRDGKLIGEFGTQRRIPLAYDEMPEQLINAFIAAEDARYFVHPGVDWRGILRAAVNLAMTGERSQGGSTITMQLARNYFLTRERTYDRKIREIFLALRMEEVLSKQQIMESYLNKIYLGERAYGVGAAARVYFGVPVEELSLSQMAVLAGLPKAPSRDNPANNPDRARERRDYVLGRMLALDFIDQERYQAAREEAILVTPEEYTVELDAHYVAEMVRQEMVARYGEAVYEDGYEVVTTIDSAEQIAAVKAVRSNLRQHSARTGYSVDRPRVPEAVRTALHGDKLPQSAVAAIRELAPLAGLVRAVVRRHEAEGMALFIEDGQPVRLTADSYSWAEFGSQRLQPGALVYVRDAAGNEGAAPLPENHRPDWQLAAEPKAESALVALSPQTGAIRALVGGYDFFNGRFNRVTQAERQPGSAMKPIIYAAAFDQGYTPASVIIDAPIVMEDYALEDKWRPRNYSGKFYGPTRLREGLVHSRNIVSIKLLRAIGVETGRDYATRFGLPEARMPNNLSLALGSPVFTPLEMARAFAVFANGGHLVTPYFIAEIREAAGETLESAESAPLCENPQPAYFETLVETPLPEMDPATPGAVEPALTPLPAPEPTEASDQARPDCSPRTVNPRVAWMLSDMMRDVASRGTGARAGRELGRRDIAGKTGTTNDEADAWFVGYQREVATAVWMGYDQPQRLGYGEGGSRAALPVWIDFMRTALAGVDEGIPSRPPGLTDVRVDPESGLLAHPESTEVVFETLPEELIPRMEAQRQEQRDDSSALDALY